MSDFLIYHCPEAPEGRQWCAQWERKKNLFSFAHGISRDHVTELAALLDAVSGMSGEAMHDFGFTTKRDAINARYLAQDDIEDLLG